MGGGQDDPPSVPGAQPGRKPGKEQGLTEAPTANTKIPPRASCSYRKNRLQLNKHINSFVKRNPTSSANHLGVVHLQYHPVRVAPRDFSPHLHKPTLLHFLLGRNLTGSGSQQIRRMPCHQKWRPPNYYHTTQQSHYWAYTLRKP